MVLEVRGKFLYFEHDKGKFEFVRIDNILACWDQYDDECEIKYISNDEDFDITVLNHTAKEVLDVLCKRRRPDGREVSKLQKK